MLSMLIRQGTPMRVHKRPPDILLYYMLTLLYYYIFYHQINTTTRLLYVITKFEPSNLSRDNVSREIGHMGRVNVCIVKYICLGIKFMVYSQLCVTRVTFVRLIRITFAAPTFTMSMSPSKQQAKEIIYIYIYIYTYIHT